jgi:hypothetical protein
VERAAARALVRAEWSKTRIGELDMSDDSNAWEFGRFSTGRGLGEVLQVLGQFVGSGPLAGWRTAYEEWTAERDAVRYDFDVLLWYAVYLEGKGFLGGMAANWMDAQGTRQPHNVEYRYVFTVVMAQCADGSTLVDTSLQEFIDPFNRCFNKGSFRAPSRAGNLGDLPGLLHQWLGG